MNMLGKGTEKKRSSKLSTRRGSMGWGFRVHPPPN